MSQAKTCSNCGAPIPDDAPKGYCPACLIRLAADALLPAGELETPEPPPTKPLPERTPGGGAPVPTLFGGYELLGEIGRGGMGVVYRARQLAINRVVALKMLLHGRFSEAAFVERFHLEAEAAAHLDHPHIVPIYEVGQQEGQPFYSMKLIEGQSLDRAIAAGSLAPMKVAELIAKLSRAVHYAHQHGVLHRDIKPHNILLDADGQPHLTDFGLAKLLNQESGLTVSAAVIGSPGFMAPEQAAGKTRRVTTAADVYGLGAVLYALLTGKPVFQADTPLETVRQVTEQEPVRPRVLNPSVDHDLETICLKCLQKEPAKRYASAQALAEDLESWLRAEPIQARRATPLERVWLWCRRKPVVASLIAALVTAIVGGFAGVLMQLHRATLAELAARKNAYVADMNLARQALEESNLGRVRTLLERYRPAKRGKAEIDLRGWEWRWLWGRSQTHERANFTGASNRVNAVALSADGRWLVALSSRDALRVWDPASRRCVARRPDASYYNDHILLAPNGDRLFAGSYETLSVKIWNVPSLEAVGEFRHTNAVSWIALSADGRLLAATDAMEVKIWDTLELRELSAIPAKQNRFGRVALSRDGRLVAFSNYDGRIYVWDWAAHRQLVELAGHGRTGRWQAAVQDLAFTPDGARLLSAGSDRTLRLWELGSEGGSQALTGHTDNIMALAFSPDGTTLATASCDQTVRLWDVATWQVRATLRGHLDEVWDVVFSADGNMLATGSKDSSVKLWEAHPPPERQCSWPVPAGTWVAAFAAEARMIGLMAADRSFRLINTKTWQEALNRPLVIPGTNLGRIVMDSRATCLVVSTDEGPLRTWRLPEANEGAAFVGHAGRVEALAFSPDGDWLASAGADHTLRLWRTDTRRQVAQFPQEHERAGTVALSPDANLLGVTFNDDELEIWERASGQQRARFAAHSLAYDIAFLHRPSHFITGSSDGTVKVWDMLTLRLETLFRGSLRGVNALAISPDDRTLATGTGEGVIKLWDLELGQEVGALKGHRESVERLGFSLDGRALLSSSTDAVCVWEAPSLMEIDTAERARENSQ